MNESIMKLLQDRYFLSTESSWDDIAKRVSVIYPDIYEHIRDMDFIPSTPTLLNANTKGERRGTLSSCFPMGIEDSIEGIMGSAKECAIVTKYGGGVGYDFSILRGSEENIKSINRNSSGPLPFIGIFNSILDGIQQGGVRRGAGMALLSINHPDILNFIQAKEDISQFTRFNFSIKITDDFYKILKERPQQTHQIQDRNGNWSSLLTKEGSTLSVKQVWDIIIDHAWKSAEPGIFNEDIAKRQCTVTNLSDQVICNPCSEFVNIPYSSCNLGSINLANFVKDKKFDWDKFTEVIKTSTQFLNAVIDKNKYPIKEIESVTKSIRPIGLGFMGLAHALYKLRIPYNSKKGKKFANDISKGITINSLEESIILAKNSQPYEAYDYDLFYKANERILKDADKKLLKDLKKYGVRNSSFTSIAPTGSISFMANTSSGIEPVFALTYSRKIEKKDKEYDIVYISDPIFEDYLNKSFEDKVKNKILKQVADNNGSCQKCEDIPEKDREVFQVAGDLTPMDHLETLKEVAVNTSLSVSKTINLPKSATKEEISNVYLKAHEYGIIGTTIYRDGSREGILVHNTDEEGIIERSAPKRPKELPCHIYRITVHGEKWIVFVGLYKGHPYEVFSGKVDLVDIPSSIEDGILIKVKKGLYQFKHGEETLIKDIGKLFTSGAEEALTRQISTNLRHGTPIDFIIEQLEKSYGTVVDFNKSILRALKRYLKDGTESSMVCPECGNKLIYFDGCTSCDSPDCAFSKCG